MIYITGDTHGETTRIDEFDRLKLTKKDVLIICGDFGYVFRNTEKEQQFLDELALKPYTFCFVDGNHENFHEMNQYPVEQWHGGKIHRIRNNIIHLMRGQIFTIEEKTFFTMGGAYSIDRLFRVRNISYWEEEIPTSEEYKEAIRNLERVDYKVNYIITHTAPREIIRRMGHQPIQEDLELTGFLEYILYETEFDHWYCGHWHEDKDVTSNFTVLWFGVRKLENE